MASRRRRIGPLRRHHLPGLLSGGIVRLRQDFLAPQAGPVLKETREVA